MNSKDYKVEWILETHVHAGNKLHDSTRWGLFCALINFFVESDHLTAAKEAKKFIGGKIGIGEHVPGVQKVFKSVFDLNIACNGSQFDRLFKDGDEFRIGDLLVKVLATPGHTPACVSYVVNNAAIFVGDTLFAEVIFRFD